MPAKFGEDDLHGLTLAAAIAQKRGLEAIHLDQMYHRPGTDWELRPTDEFVGLHDAAIAACKLAISDSALDRVQDIAGGTKTYQPISVHNTVASKPAIHPPSQEATKTAGYSSNQA